MGPRRRIAVLRQPPVSEQDTAGGVGVPISFGNPNLREEQADTWTIGVAMDILEDWSLTVDWYQIQIENMIALESADTTYQRCMDIAFNPTGDINNPACQRIERNPTTGGGATVDRSFTNEGRADFSGVDLRSTGTSSWITAAGSTSTCRRTCRLEEITQDQCGARADRPTPASTAAGCSCSARTTTTGCSPRSATAEGCWNMSVTHQYWPELKNNACRTNTVSVACVYNSLPAYGLFSLSGNYRFRPVHGERRYREPARRGAAVHQRQSDAPRRSRRTCSHGTGDGSTYDPLGRRFFLSMNMEF